MWQREKSNQLECPNAPRTEKCPWKIIYAERSERERERAETMEQSDLTRQTESNEPVFLESGFATNNG